MITTTKRTTTARPLHVCYLMVFFKASKAGSKRVCVCMCLYVRFCVFKGIQNGYRTGKSKKGFEGQRNNNNNNELGNKIFTKKISDERRSRERNTSFRVCVCRRIQIRLQKKREGEKEKGLMREREKERRKNC